MSSDDRYRWLFRKSPALSVSLSEDGFFLDASDAWLERFGYSRDELSSLRPQDVSSPESARRIVEDYMPLLRRAGCLTDVPIDLLTRDGELVECIANAIVERDDHSGDFVRTVAVYTELGAEARIEQHYRDIYRDTPAMLHTVDSMGRVVYVSDRWLTKFGYRREEIIGRYITDFMTDDSLSNPDQSSLADIVAQAGLLPRPIK